MARDLDMSDVERDGGAAAAANPALHYTGGDVAMEIVHYLPNPGQYQQAIVAANIDPTGRVILTLDNGQQFWLEIRPKLNQ